MCCTFTALNAMSVELSMARPVLRLKPRNLQAKPEGAESCPECEGWLQYDINLDRTQCVKCGLEKNEGPKELHAYPAFWLKGQLLNNRKNGDSYVVTILGEELDPDHPERALFFTNSFDCQGFISWWYDRTSHDPRAG